MKATHCKPSVTPAAFLDTVDYAELKTQRQWLQQQLAVAGDTPGQQLLGLLDKLTTVFAITMQSPRACASHWRAVARMKHWLIDVVGNASPNNTPGVGLIHLLDAVQDYAVDVQGVPLLTAFPSLRKPSSNKQVAIEGN